MNISRFFGLLILFNIFGCQNSPTLNKNNSKKMDNMDFLDSNLKSISLSEIDETIVKALSDDMNHEFNLRLSTFQKQFNTSSFTISQTQLSITHQFYQTPFNVIIGLSKGKSNIKINDSEICEWEYRVVSVVSSSKELKMLYSNSGCNLSDFILLSIKASENGYDITGSDETIITYLR